MSASYSKALLVKKDYYNTKPLLDFLENNNAVLGVKNKWMNVYYYQYKKKWFDIYFHYDNSKYLANEYFGINVDPNYYLLFKIEDTQNSTNMKQLFTMLSNLYPIDDNYMGINVTNHKHSIIKLI